MVHKGRAPDRRAIYSPFMNIFRWADATPLPTEPVSDDQYHTDSDSS